MEYEVAKRKAAIRALINIAVLEAFVLLAVIGVYLYTNKIVHLVGGVVGSALIFGPVFFRWFREHGAAFSPQNKPRGRAQ